MYPNSYSLDQGLALWGNNSLGINDLRRISKRLHKDNVFISTFTKSFLQLVISSGITLRIQTSDKAKRSQLKTIWESFSYDASVSGDVSLDDLIRQYIASILIDGDVLVYVSERNNKLKYNSIPGYRVSNPIRKANVIHFKSKEVVDLTDSYIDSGIVYDRGEIIGYTFSNLDASMPYLFIPRKNGNSFSSILIKSPISLDTDMARGVPLLASGVKVLDDITNLVNAETKVAKLRSKLAAILKTSGLSFENEEAKKDFLSKLNNSVQEIIKNDASIFIPYPGTELAFPDNKANNTSSFELLIKPLLVFVAGLYGVSYDALSHDLKDNTSAIARLIYMTAWTDTAIWRNSIITKLLDPFFELLAEYNNISLDDVNWQINCRPYGYVKSKEEIEANQAAIASGQKTLAEVAAESGKDVEDILSERAEIEKYRNTVDPDYTYALDLMERLKERPEVAKSILISKGYTQEVINTLYG